VIILGLGLTEILRNIGGQIRIRSKIKVYPLQIFASCLLIFFILMWLWGFSKSIEVTWTLPVFLIQVLPAIAFALSAQILGLDFNSTRSAEQQYFGNCRAIYLILASIPLFGVITTTVLRGLYRLPEKRLQCSLSFVLLLRELWRRWVLLRNQPIIGQYL